MTSNSLVVPAGLLASDSHELKIAAQAAIAGARIILEYYQQGVQMRAKPDDASYNLVSDADVNSEKAIAEVIERQFPDHEILGEEEYAGSIDAEHLWVVDPLDGTNNFAHHIPHFAVSIAYYRQGVAQCGVVVNPVRGDWYFAVRGLGAFHNEHRMRVSQADQLNQVMVGCGFYYDRGAMMEATLAAVHDFFKQEIHGIRRFGTAALDLCHVADGLYGAFFEYQLAPWDFAAGRLILEEAGGSITDARGGPLELKTTSILASNTRLHPPALEITARHHPK